jgi:hypothetical protein
MIDDLDTDTLALMPFEHDAMRPPREGHIGENVFIAAWKALHEAPAPSAWDDDTENWFLRTVLSSAPGALTQRRATVCASMAQWLGTNAGRSFLWEAQKDAKHSLTDTRAYLGAWANINKRVRWLNYGVRALEFTLASADDFSALRCFLDPGLRRLPELSTDDYETAEHFVAWLAEPEGKAFLTQCEDEVTRQYREKRADEIRRHCADVGDDTLMRVMRIEPKQPPSTNKEQAA